MRSRRTPSLRRCRAREHGERQPQDAQARSRKVKEMRSRSRLGSVIGITVVAVAVLVGSGQRAYALCPGAPLASFGPFNAFGFPAYYIESNRLAHEHCVDPADPTCTLDPMPFPDQPPTRTNR